MSTITTRPLSKDEKHDIAAVRVSLKDFQAAGQGKWGFLTISVTGYSWTDGTGGAAANAGTLDLRAPNFCDQCEDALLDSVALANTVGSVGSLTLKYTVAVNNGLPGPSAQINPDGSADVLWFKYDLPSDTLLTNQTATLTYSVTFTDLTPTTTENTGTTVDLKVHDDVSTDTVTISKAASDLASKTGRVTLVLNSLKNVSGDVPKLAPAGGNLLPDWRVADDGAPIFVFSSMSGELSLAHGMAKRSGKTFYNTHALMVFAINGGKVDLNGLNVKRHEGNGVLFATCMVSKVAEIPCDDNVKATVDYTYNYTDA